MGGTYTPFIGGTDMKELKTIHKRSILNRPGRVILATGIVGSLANPGARQRSAPRHAVVGEQGDVRNLMGRFQQHGGGLLNDHRHLFTEFRIA
jgi:hypothetical protein